MASDPPRTDQTDDEPTAIDTQNDAVDDEATIADPDATEIQMSDPDATEIQMSDPDATEVQMSDPDATLEASSPDQIDDSVWAETIAGATMPGSTLQTPPSEPPSTARTLVLKARDVNTLQQSDFTNPDYVFEQILGEGGMGAVFNARQRSIDRSVAVKVMKSRSARIDSHQYAFIAEAMITGELDHPNIVPIYDMGRQSDNAPFYAMKRVQGVEWTKLIGTYSLEQNLDVLMRVADAIAFSHSKHILHRDLKPANVMIGRFNEVLVMDWGLATPTNSHPRLSAFPRRRYGGTPSYMAPEMVDRNVDRVDERSDVYLLGALLYQIQTGHAPHQGQDTKTCLNAAAANEIAAADEPGELMNVALQAMATSPDDRYQTVEDFQTAVRECQSHAESIALTARSVDALQQAQESGDYFQYSRAVFGFEDALALWADNGSARDGLFDARLKFARQARGRGDFELALSVLTDSGPDADDLRTGIQQDVTGREGRDRNLKRAKAALIAASLLLLTGLWYWRSSETRRIENRREIALALQHKAEAALEDQDFATVTASLTQAVGAVSNEPRLDDLEVALQSFVDQIAPLEREDKRIDEMARRIESGLSSIQVARSDPERRLEQAAVVVDLVDEVQSELRQLRSQRAIAGTVQAAALNHWIAQLESQQQALDTTRQQKDVLQQVENTLQAFHDQLDRIRFAAVEFPGESQAAANAQRQQRLLSALEFLLRHADQSVSIPDESIPGTDDETDVIEQATQIARQLTSLEHETDGGLLDSLSDQQTDRLKDALFELFVRLSDAAVQMADRTTSDSLDSAAAWLDVADTLQSGRRSVLERKADLLQRAGRDAEHAQTVERLKHAAAPTSQDLFLIAERARWLGRVEEAERYYRDAVQTDSGHVLARYHAGVCALESGRPAAALADFAVCIEQRPDTAGTFVMRALAYLQVDEFAKAATDADRALEIDRDLYSAWMTRGMVHAELSQHADAQAAFSRAMTLRPDAALPQINRGELKRQTAVGLMQQNAQANQDEIRSLLSAALDDFTAALQHEPQSVRALLFRGQTWATVGQTDRAIQDLKEAIRLGAEGRFVVDCYREIGRVQLRSRQAEAALWSFSRALEVSPDDPGLLQLKSEALRRLGRDQAFVDSLSQYLKVGQASGGMFWQRGLAQQRLGLLREAMQDYTRLLDSGDSNYRGEVLNRRGWMYLVHAHRFAERDFDEAIQLQPENPDHYNGRGFARAMTGDYTQAVADAELAVDRILPEFQEKGLIVWPLYFNAATIYGQAVRRVGDDSELTAAERSERLQKYLDRTIALLDAARQSADNSQHTRIGDAIQQEASFESLRNSPAFRDAIERFQSSP